MTCHDYWGFLQDRFLEAKDFLRCRSLGKGSMAQKLQRKSPTQVDARNHSFMSRLDLKGKKNSDDLMVTAIFDDAPLKNETSGEVKISAENCLFHPFYTSKKSSPTIKKRPLADIISASPAAVRPLHRRSAQGLWTHRMASAIATWPICRGPTGRRTSTWGHAGHAGHARR